MAENITNAIKCIVTEEDKWFNTIFLSVVTALTIIGNSVALHAFFVSPELKRITYYFIASLCISDLLIAFISMPLWAIDTFLCYETHKALKMTYLALDLFCATWSIMSLAMISIERFVCIKYALHYYSILTQRRAYYMMIFVVIYAGIVTTIQVTINFDNKDYRYSLAQFSIVLLSYVVPVTIKIVSYFHIYKEASRQSKQIRSYKLGSNNNDTGSETELTEVSTPESPVTTPKKSLRKSESNTSSRVSWTTSPLARKRQVTQERIKVLHDLNEEGFESSDDSSSLNNSSNANKFQNPAKDTAKVSHKFSFINRITKRTSSSSRNTANGTYKIIRADKKVSFPPLLNNDKVRNDDNHNSDNKKQLSVRSHEGNLFPGNQSPKTNGELYCEDIDQRKRSVSCPANTATRKSLEPADAYDIIDNRSSHKSNKSSPASSPLLQRLRAASSKWSPGNSPSMFRRKSLKIRSENKRREQKIKRFKKELRAAKVVALIMGTFLFCWTPFISLVAMEGIKPYVEFDYPLRFVVYAKALHFINSTLNPILYVVLNRVYRSAVMKIIKRIRFWTKT